MAIFGWFSRKKAVAAGEARFDADAAPQETTQPMSMDEPTPAAAVPTSPATHSRSVARRAENAALREQLRADSLGRREHLYGAVRESLLRVGILVSSYKFKVLALDQSGRQYLVMIDLASSLNKTTAQMTEVENLIAQNAKTQFDIVVTGVYWRMNEQMRDTKAASGPTVPAPPVAAPLIVVPSVVKSVVAVTPSGPPVAIPPVSPAPMEAPTPKETPATVETAAAKEESPASPHGARYEPLQTEEMLAFKRALAATGTAPQPPAGPRPSPRSYSPLATGYEDTQVVSPETRPPGLGSTQYGDL